MKLTVKKTILMGIVLAAGVGIGGTLMAQTQDEHLGYQDTPLVPGMKWHVHDGLRPQPKVVTPGTFSSQDKLGTPPSEAKILFDGTDLSKWESNGKPAGWKVENGYAEIVGGTGSIMTKEPIGDFQLHIEWSAPTPPKGNWQGRRNSGVLFFGKYEIQVLDS